MKVVVAGAGGLVGRRLVRALSERGHDVVRLVRAASARGKGPAREVRWEPGVAGAWTAELEGAGGVVNLGGEGIAEKRWTPARKKALIESRLKPTRALAEAVCAASSRPGVFVSASAIGFYGARADGPLDETSSPGTGFLPDLCREWERQARKAEAAGVRTVLLRTGIVLAPEGGALAKMLPPFRLGLGGPLGDGAQVMSWIHIDDEVGAILKALGDARLSGAVNLTAPRPVPMRDFARTLASVLRRPAVMPVPAFVLRAALGEMSELLLTGQDVRPRRLAEAGFQFRFPALDGALRDLLRRG